MFSIMQQILSQNALGRLSSRETDCCLIRPENETTKQRRLLFIIRLTVSQLNFEESSHKHGVISIATLRLLILLRKNRKSGSQGSEPDA